MDSCSKAGKTSELAEIYSLFNSVIIQLTLNYKSHRQRAELCRICSENIRKFEAAITAMESHGQRA